MFFTMFLLFITIMAEAATSLVNPSEVSTLAHQPINGPTYSAARLTHLILLVAYYVPALNLAPSLAALALKETEWYYPFTCLMAAFLAGLFVAFLACGIYGWMFRLVPPSRLKNLAVWIQAVILTLFPLLGQIADKFVHWMKHAEFLAWMPPAWFLFLALLGHRTQMMSPNWQVILAFAIVGLAIALGLRSFSGDYLLKTAELVHGPSRLNQVSFRSRFVEWISARLPGTPAGRAAFAFTGKMAARDWHFRRQVYPMVLYIIIFAVITGGVKGIAISPFIVQQLSPAFLLPHLVGFALLMVCSMISYSDEYQGAWLFSTVPMRALKSYVRGIYWSLWIPAVGLTHFLTLVLCGFFWGAKHIALFIFFSASLCSLYLSLELLLIKKLPFTSQPKPVRDASLTPSLLLATALMLILLGLQWLLFRRQDYTLVAGLLFGLMAYGFTWIALRGMEGRIRSHLFTTAQGAPLLSQADE
jgi:hypothetical protein